MRLAVTAATGQLGRHVVSALLDLGVPPAHIVAVARSPHKAADMAEQGVTVRRGDYDDADSLRAAFEGVDRVLLIPGMAMPAPRVVQHQTLLDAAREAGVAHVLFYSLVGAHPDNPFIIAPYLLYAERATRSSGMAWTILRNTLYAGPLLNWVPTFARTGTIPYPTGEGRMTFASREDIGRAGAAALAGEGHEGKIYELTGPETFTTEELCAVVSEATGKPVRHSHPQVADYVRTCVEEGVPESAAHFLATLYAPVPLGLNALCTDHIEQLTGTAARGLRELIADRYPDGLPD